MVVYNVLEMCIWKKHKLFSRMMGSASSGVSIFSWAWKYKWIELLKTYFLKAINCIFNGQIQILGTLLFLQL